MLVFEVTAAFVNTDGNIEVRSNTFGASNEAEASDDAKLYFPKRYEGSNFIYGKPSLNEAENYIGIRGLAVQRNKNSLSVGTGTVRMVQINNGDAIGAQILTGDDNVTFIGSSTIGLGDK